MLVDETEKKNEVLKKNQANSCELCKFRLISQTRNPLNCRFRFN